MAKPFVTIGVCVRNCASTLSEAIESIIAQDYPHELIEVIFVDDGSEDNTLSVIKSYVPKMDMQVKIFHHEWKGLGYSRNVVLNNAKGKYIIWVDGDLILPPNYVREMVEFMEKHHNIAIAGGTYEIFSQNTITFLENIHFLAYRLKSGTNLPGTGGAIFRVKAIRQVGGFDKNIKGSCEDIEIAHRLKKSGWGIVRDKALFYGYSKQTWKEIWKHSLWHGYGAHYVKHKDDRILSLAKMTPPVVFIAGILYSVAGYKAKRRKIAFLLPFYLTFKSIAWWIGYIKSHIQEYGHTAPRRLDKRSK